MDFGLVKFICIWLDIFLKYNKLFGCLIDYENDFFVFDVFIDVD